MKYNQELIKSKIKKRIRPNIVIRTVRRFLKRSFILIVNCIFIPARLIIFYYSYFKNSKNAKTNGFVEYCDNDNNGVSYTIKPVAFYLPQFHQIPENDEWWGVGFTEWTNVTRSIPQFLGHYQPRLPGDLGFYDLRLKEVQQRQIDIARNYGVHAFCYYYYWFGGKRLLELPVDRHLTDKSMKHNYCLCWANENWTRTWDGGENEILLAQCHSAEDDIAFIQSLIPHFNDDRYLRFNGRPMLLVYHARLLPDIKATVARWRDYCRSVGVGEIYLLNVHAKDVYDPKDFNFDAAVEFPPGGHAEIKSIGLRTPFLNPLHKGKVLDFNALRDYFLKNKYPDYRAFRGIMTGWDNEARRPGAGRIYANSTPESFGKWFAESCRLTSQEIDNGEKYIFINAWNEWAEGTYLEPDRKYGYAYIDQLYKVIENYKLNE